MRNGNSGCSLLGRLLLVLFLIAVYQTISACSSTKPLVCPELPPWPDHLTPIPPHPHAPDETLVQTLETVQVNYLACSANIGRLEESRRWYESLRGPGTGK